MAENNRTCNVCHQPYHYCSGSCQESKGLPVWMATFCSDNCYSIYSLTSGFENGQIKADEAKGQLDKLDLSKLENFSTSYKNSISKIMDSASKSTNIIKKVEPVIKKAEDKEVKSDEIKSEKETSVKRKSKRYNRNFE